MRKPTYLRYRRLLSISKESRPRLGLKIPGKGEQGKLLGLSALDFYK